MPSTRTANALLASAALCGLCAARSEAGLLIDVRAVTLNGTAPGGANAKTIAARVGDTVGLRVFADVTGSDPLKFQCLQSLSGSFLSIGSVKGNLILSAAGLVIPFNAPGASVGQQIDLDGDGDLDVGSNFPTDPGGHWAVRSAYLVGLHSHDDGGQVGWPFPP